MAGASAAVERRKASALRSARAASDDAAQDLRLPALCLPLFFRRRKLRAVRCQSSDAYASRERASLSVHRHPEEAAKRPAKDAGPSAEAVALRGSLRSRLRVTETTHAQALRPKKDQQ